MILTREPTTAPGATAPGRAYRVAYSVPGGLEVERVFDPGPYAEDEAKRFGAIWALDPDPRAVLSLERWDGAQWVPLD